MTSRVLVQMFAGDLLAHPPSFEHYPALGVQEGAVVLDDGDGTRVAVSGDRSSLRLLFAGALAQLGPPQPPPAQPEEPPEEPATSDTQDP